MVAHCTTSSSKHVFDVINFSLFCLLLCPAMLKHLLVGDKIVMVNWMPTFWAPLSERRCSDVTFQTCKMEEVPAIEVLKVVCRFWVFIPCSYWNLGKDAILAQATRFRRELLYHFVLQIS